MFRTLAVCCAAMASIVLAFDLWPLLTGTAWSDLRFTALGEVWFRVSPNSLQLLQPAIERNLSPAIWEHGIQPLLEGSLALELAVLALLFWLLRKRARGGPTRRRGFQPGSRR